MIRKALPLLVASLLAACAAPAAIAPSTTAPSAGTPVAAPAEAAKPPILAGVSIKGAVSVPATMVAAGGMNLVAAGGMNFVSTNGGNMVAAGGMNYSVQSIESRGIVGARVYLADARGQAVAGIAQTKTDARGSYTLENVPEGFTFVVVAEVDVEGGRIAKLRTLTKSTREGAVAPIDTGTTLATAGVLGAAAGADLGDVDPTTFAGLAGHASAAIDAAPDLTDEEGLKARMAAIVAQMADAKTAEDALRAQVASVTRTQADLKTAIANTALPPSVIAPGLRPSAEPTATAEPTPGACTEPRAHRFRFRSGVTDVTTVQFIDAAGGVAAEGRVTGEGVVEVNLPEGCVVEVKLYDRLNNFLRSLKGYFVPVNAGKELTLDL